MRNLFGEENSIPDLLLSYIAFSFNGREKDTVSGAFSLLFQVPLYVTSKTLSELKSQGLIVFNKKYNSYDIDAQQRLCTLKKFFSDSNNKQFINSERFYFFVSSEITSLNCVRDSIRDYVINGSYSREKHNVFPDPEFFFPLFLAMTKDDYWTNYIKGMPTLFWQSIGNYMIRMMDEGVLEQNREIREQYLYKEDYSGNLATAFREFFALYDYLFLGRFDEYMNDFPQIESNYGQIPRAIFYQYIGNTKEAIRLFEFFLKTSKRKEFPEAFSNYVYVNALIADGDKSRNKLVKFISRKSFIASFNSLPAYLLGNYYIDIRKTITNYDIEDYTLIDKLLIKLINTNYNKEETKSDNKKDSNINYNQIPFKLLRLELSKKFNTTDHTITYQNQELKPLIPVYEMVPEWKLNILQAINIVNSHNQIKAINDTKKGQQSRIVYILSGNNSFTPRILKSTDGIKWTKGRNIALKTFYLGIPEMTDVDRRIAKYVKREVAYWGETETYDLCGDNIFKELVDYPYVYHDKEMNVPIKIIAEDVTLNIKKVRDGYTITSNINVNYIKNVNIIRENEFLYKVINLTSIQQRILTSLLEVKIYPFEAKSQLEEMVAVLSKNITILSDVIEVKTQNAEQFDADTAIVIQMKPYGEGLSVELFEKPFITKPPYCKPGKGSNKVFIEEEGIIKVALRNLKEENNNNKKIVDLLLKYADTTDSESIFDFSDIDAILEFLNVLPEYSNISRIEWPEGAKFKILPTNVLQDLSLQVSGGTRNWLEVSGSLKVDEKRVIELAELLRRVRDSKSRFIAIGKDEYIPFTDRLRKSLLHLSKMVNVTKKGIELSSFSSEIITDFEKFGIAVKKDAKFKDLEKKIKASTTKTYELPKNLNVELREYQVDGFCWMSKLANWGAGACLADDMGLGKTVQTIALLQSRATEGASLILVPASVVINWKNEINRFAPALTVQILNNPDEKGRKEIVQESGRSDIILSSYGLLVTEAELLSGKQWNVIVLDEAHTIKNRNTKISKSAMTLQAQFKVMLTGTPLQNNLGEIWNLFNFANPGLLGSNTQFNERFIVPIEKNKDKEVQKTLKRILSPYILRRTKNDVLDELPAKTEITKYIKLYDDEMALYENLRREALIRLENSENTLLQTLAEITKLRLSACNSLLTDKQLRLPSAKMDTLLELVDELISNKHRALIFSQFTKHLSLVREELDKKHIDYCYLDGSTSISERSKLVDNFQKGIQPLFLISLKAGGIGLNLTAADYVIHLDPWWNPAIEDQASDRAYRIGQERPVTIYKMIAENTIEDKIIALHKNKKSLADALLEGSDMANKLSNDDILELLRLRN